MAARPLVIAALVVAYATACSTERARETVPSPDAAPPIADAPPPGCAAPAADFVVATTGNDQWSGTLAAPDATGGDGPFLTLSRAQAAVRALPRTGRTTPITVLVRGGTYVLTEHWALDASDAGTAAVPIIYAAYPCETPIISGGLAVDTWVTGADGVLTATLPATTPMFAQLWVNDVRRYRPRALGGGYGTVAMSSATGFQYADPTSFSPAWHNLNDVEVLAFEFWTMSRQRIQSIDPVARTVTTTPFINPDQFHGYLDNHRYLVENVLEALAPGQFYIDSVSHVLTYMPAPGETAANVHAIVPVLGQLMVTDELAYTTFRGLQFSHTNFVLPATGYQAAQALWDLPPALELVNPSHVVFDGCMFRHLGASALALEGNDGFVATPADPYAAEIVNNELSDLGANGLRLGEPPGNATDATATQAVHVANNIFTGGGRYLAGGMAITVGESHNNLLEHNEISDFYQTGISIGYTFAYQPNGDGTIALYPPTLAHDNVVSANLIHDLGHGVTDDMGGIYLLTGTSTGNAVTGNVIHDMVNSGPPVGYGANGIYFDQGTSNVLASNNLVYRISDAGIQQNMGRANTFDNNIFAFMKLRTYHHQFLEPPSILWGTLTHNLVLFDQGQMLDGLWVCPAGSDCRSFVDLHDNDDFYATGGAVGFTLASPPGSLSLTQFQTMESEELGSITTDPGFAGLATDDFTLPADSPAAGIGFVPFPLDTAGRTNPVLMPAAVPAGYPLGDPADPTTFF